MAHQEIIVECKDHIATITLNRPQQLNAWTDIMAEEVHAAMWAASADVLASAMARSKATRASSLRPSCIKNAPRTPKK